MQKQDAKLPRLSPRAFVLEIAFIVILALFAGRDWMNWDADAQLIGEGQWLTSSANYADQSLRMYGGIPRWQPYLSRGEPAIDGAFHFLLNPISTLPSLIIGYDNGIKVSSILYIIFSGLGGWVLARVLGLSWAGRVLLAVLFIFKGPMYLSTGKGYFQLGTSQAYLQWILAAAVAIVRFPRRRYPVVLFAIMVTFQFWAGNIYYVLPSMFMALLLFVFYSFRTGVPTADGRVPFSIAFDWHMIARMGLALILTAILAAMTLIPILVNNRYIGGHPDEVGAGTYADPIQVFTQLFDSEILTQFTDTGVWNENYYIYSIPLWFIVFAIIIAPELARVAGRGRADLNGLWRFWVVGIISFLFFFAWGTGTNQIVAWAYENLPLIGQWRVVGRMLTVVSFWLVVFATIRFDQLFAALQLDFNAARFFDELSAGVIRINHGRLGSNFFGILLIGVGTLAAGELIGTRAETATLAGKPMLLHQCLTWLREQNPDVPLSVHSRDYFMVSSYIDNRIRTTQITADFDPEGTPNTIYTYDLTEINARYMMPYFTEEQDYWGTQGYAPMPGSPMFEDNSANCMWENPNTLDYIFTMPLDTLQANEPIIREYDLTERFPIEPALTTPVHEFGWREGVIGIQINNPTNEPVAVIVQEVAWPGWELTNNGQAVPLEVAGGLIAYVMQPNSENTLIFMFANRLLTNAGVITLVACAFSIAYLAGADRLIRRRRMPEPTITAFEIHPADSALSINGAHEQEAVAALPAHSEVEDVPEIAEIVEHDDDLERDNEHT